MTCLPFLFEPVAEHLENPGLSLMSLTRDVSVARLAWHVRLACVASDVFHMVNTSRALEVLQRSEASEASHVTQATEAFSHCLRVAQGMPLGRR